MTTTSRPRQRRPPIAHRAHRHAIENAEVARIFGELADLLELGTGEGSTHEHGTRCDLTERRL